MRRRIASRKHTSCPTAISIELIDDAARQLTEAGVAPPLRADGAWSPAMILRLLHNEKYCGDLLQKKYRTVDHLTHRKVVNRGAEEQFRLENHHPAIVSRAQFAAVQAELARRAEEGEELGISAHAVCLLEKP